MILSLSVLGLGCGGIFAYYKLPETSPESDKKSLRNVLSLLATALFVFALASTEFQAIIQPILFFSLLFIPFFLAGIFYALIFRIFANNSFTVYAADLIGAATGSLLAIAVMGFFGPVNGIILLSIILLGTAFSLADLSLQKSFKISIYAVLGLVFVLMIFNQNKTLLNEIPIGPFPEKDFHSVYDDPRIISTITDSRWSIFGRSDLVQHSHQDMVRHLFVDGAAGSQMYRFDGNIQNPDQQLQQLLLSSTSTIPFLFLDEHERNNLLVIGPGGGKEVLTGLISGVQQITGVEINRDFVRLVEQEKEFNGGIYTDFPNVQILIKEGRQYVKQQTEAYDIIAMVLPSTQQVQHIENYALSENYLLTVEAMTDYLDVLTDEGRLIFTVYNEWELKRLITTTLKAFQKRDIDTRRAVYHFMVLEDQFTPTLVVKKQAFTPDEVSAYQQMGQQIPDGFPGITFMPYVWGDNADTSINRFISSLYNQPGELRDLIRNQPFDISATYDDSPYFYNIHRGISGNFAWLLGIVGLLNVLIITIPYALLPAKKAKKQKHILLREEARWPVFLFSILGLGFMMLEVALFQKLVLYLGTPTVSLSILLGSILVGMGTGSYFGLRWHPQSHSKRLFSATLAIVGIGGIVIFLYPVLLNALLAYSLVLRSVITFFLLLPLGFVLGIPFPTGLRMLQDEGSEQLIPWMYGINGTMSVLGSVLTVILSMIFGFTPAYLVGLGCYGLLLFVVFRRLGVGR